MSKFHILPNKLARTKFLFFRKKDIMKQLIILLMIIFLIPITAFGTTDQSPDFFNKGMKFHQSGFHQEAEIQFNKAIELNSKFEEAYNARGIIRIYLKNYEEALTDFNTAIKLNPKYDAAFSNRGTVWTIKGDYAKAKENFDMALQLNPQSAKAFFNRGNAHIKLNQNYLAAIEDYKKALALDPNYEDARKNMELINKEIKKNGENFIKLAELLTPPDPPPTFLQSCLNAFFNKF